MGARSSQPSQPRRTTLGRGARIMAATGAAAALGMMGAASDPRRSVDVCSRFADRGACLVAAHDFAGYGREALSPEARWAETPYGHESVAAARPSRLERYHRGESGEPGPEFYSGVHLGDLSGVDPSRLTTERATVYRGAGCPGCTVERTFAEGLPAPYWRDASKHPMYPQRAAPVPRVDLRHHVGVGYYPGEVYASTSPDRQVAGAFSRLAEGDGAVYQIDLPAGKGLSTTGLANGDIAAERQIAVPGGVPGARIRRAWRQRDLQDFRRAERQRAGPQGPSDESLARIADPTRHVAAIENPGYEDF